MTAEEYLEQYRDALLVAQRLKREYEKEEKLLDSIASPLGSDGTPHGTGISRATESKAIKLAEKLSVYKEAELEALRIKRQVLRTINRVPGAKGAVLYEKYINFLTMQEIADKIGYTERHCYNLKDAGLEIVEKMIERRK